MKMFLTYKCSSLGRSVKAPFLITLRLLIFRTDLPEQKEKSRGNQHSAVGYKHVQIAV